MTEHTAFVPDTPPIEIETGPNPHWSIIWMHGLGADGSDFVPIVPELGLPDQPALRFIFPHAPFRPVTCNGGYVMRAWYDIILLAPGTRQIDEAGLLESRAFVRQLIEREVARGVPLLARPQDEVGQVHHLGGAAVVADEAHDLGAGVPAGEAEQVVRRGPGEGVDGLGGVAHDA